MTYKNDENDPRIFVFGSNEAGKHGAGAAAFAQKYRGAEFGKDVGRVGQSYALPTKDRFISSLSIDRINTYAKQFIEYAENHPELTFQLTAVGCGLAGFKSEEIAPLFVGLPDNVDLPPEWDRMSFIFGRDSSQNSYPVRKK